MAGRQILLGAGFALAVVAVLVVGFALGRLDDDGSDDALRALTVSGTGSVEAAPDVAEVSLGVSSTAKTAAAARSAADAGIDRVLAAVKAKGVADADVQTSQVSLSPNFGRDGSSVVSYTARNTILARVRELASAGAVVTSAARAGANDISGPSLTLSDEKAEYARALQAAVEDARVHAVAIAEATGDSVGELRSLTEGGDGGPIPYAIESKAADAAGAAIEPGTLEITATVTASFELE